MKGELPAEVIVVLVLEAEEYFLAVRISLVRVVFLDAETRNVD